MMIERRPRDSKAYRDGSRDPYRGRGQATGFRPVDETEREKRPSSEIFGSWDRVELAGLSEWPKKLIA